MKFYYIAGDVLDPESAQAIHIDEVCRALKRSGHAVTLYAPRRAGVEVPKSYETRFLTVPDVLSTVFFQLRLVIRVRHDMRAGKPDVIYVRHSLLLFMPVVIGKLFGVPVVLEVNGPLIEESRRVDHSAQARILRALRIFRVFESFSVRGAMRLVVVAPGIGEYLVRNYAVDPGAVVVIANGVDAAVFMPRDVTDTRLSLGLTPDLLYVGYVGSLNSWQGVRHMIEAAGHVLAGRDGVAFLIVGTGDERGELEALAGDMGLGATVRFLPPVAHDLVAHYVAALDICLCYPTRFRENTTSPFKVYEYLACAKAVVLADLQGMREAFGDVVAYAAPEDPRALAEQIGRLADDREERERLGARGLAFIRAEHTWARVAERLVGVAESAVEARP
jgi:glycosyltransferase involved in cell wall biosynthesis